jgi:hypothetical protein
MRKWQLISAVTVGIMASGSGFIQAQAADYTFFVDFNTKTVANFDDFDQMFFNDTYNLNGLINFTLNTEYRMNSCPPSAATDVFLQIRYQLNGTGTSFQQNIDLPDMPCTVGNTNYQISGSINLPDDHVNFLINDDANFLRLIPLFQLNYNSNAPTRIITLTNPEFVYGVSYNFNTTYLFNYFLSDQDILNDLNTTSGVTFTGTKINDFDYVMTTAGNDRFFLINDRLTNFGTSRLRWAINYNDEYFRGNSIGSRYKQIFDGTMTINLTSTSQWFRSLIDYFYLNAATNNQPIVDVPEFDFEYEDCGSFLALNVGCFINNGLAYITNDAPIISDAITLLNAGMQMAGQAFGVIGSFTDDNVFGVLVLGGLGLIAVRWFLKND